MNGKSVLPYIIAGAAGAIVTSLIPLVVSQSKAETKLLPFQGRLTDATGSAIDDGPKVVEFKMYDAPTGGNLKSWAGEVHKLSVNGGLVNTMLGSKASLSDVDFSTPTYLQITIDAQAEGQAGYEIINAADPPLLPRQSVVPAVYAVQAGDSAKLGGRPPDDFISKTGDRVGIGTGTPGAKLDVVTTDPFVLSVSGGPNGSLMMVNSASTDDFYLGTVTSLAGFGLKNITDNRFDFFAADSGNVGIGTESPESKLHVAGDAKVDGNLTVGGKLFSEVSPPGAIIAFIGLAAPTGWLLCDGSEKPISIYPALGAAIGTRFGVSSSPATMFKLPDLRGMFLRGAIPSLQVSFTGSPSSNNIAVASHPFNRTGMRVRVTNPVTGLSPVTDYFIIAVSSTQVAFASTKSNALANTKLPISGSTTNMTITQTEDPDAANRSEMAVGGAVGNAVGSVQDDSFQGHHHALYYRNPAGGFEAANPGESGIMIRLPNLEAENTGGPTKAVKEPTPDGTHGPPRISNETRSKNVYVNYIIKY